MTNPNSTHSDDPEAPEAPAEETTPTETTSEEAGLPNPFDSEDGHKPKYESVSQVFTFVSAEQEAFFNEILTRNGWTEQWAKAQWPKVTRGRIVINLLLREERNVWDAQKIGVVPEDSVMERLDKGIQCARQHGLTALADQGQAKFDDLDADLLVISRAIDSLERRLKVRGIDMPWVKKNSAQVSTEVNAGALEASSVVGAIPGAEAPF